MMIMEKNCRPVALPPVIMGVWRPSFAASLVWSNFLLFFRDMPEGANQHCLVILDGDTLVVVGTGLNHKGAHVYHRRLM